MDLRIGNTCVSSNGDLIKVGEYFVPVGRDVCEQCKCIAGQAVGCFTQICQPPECNKFRLLNGKCCEYECIEGDDLSDKQELAVIISLSIGLVLLLALLLAIFYRRRQSLKMNDKKETETNTQSDSSVIEETQSSKPDDEHATGSSNSGSTNTRHIEQGNQPGNIELPPPYSPPENIVTVNKSRVQQRLPPNEPPPPYDREESTV